MNSPSAFAALVSGSPSDAAVQGLESVIDMPLMWKHLESLQDQIKLNAIHNQLMIGTAAVATTGLSVGFVVWMLRGGYLMASLLSSLPAWSFIDPLPILDELDNSNRPKREDGESLESIIDRAEQRALSAKSDSHKESEA